MEGILQLQVSLRLKVPRVTPATMVAPKYQEAVKMEPRRARSFGWESSVYDSE